MASRVRIKPEQLEGEIAKILSEYNDEIEENLDVITTQVAKKGVQALKNEAKDKFNGNKYWKSWTSSKEKYKHYVSVVIHSKMPGLPHLLEHGHALVLGGRKVGHVDGREHIAKVEDELIKSYEEEVISRL